MAWIRFSTVGFCLSIGTINCEEYGCNKIPSIEITNDQQLANELKKFEIIFLQNNHPVILIDYLQPYLLEKIIQKYGEGVM